MIRLSVPSIDESDVDAVSRVLRTGFLVQGAEVAAFEAALKPHIGTEHVVAVSNCTAALELVLRAIGVGPGDRVIVTAYSWLSTANVIALLGAESVFVDIEHDTFNVSPQELSETLAKTFANRELARRTKAILVVHTFGQLANVAEIAAIAKEYNIPWIEDAACALGARNASGAAGSFGDAGCFSFHPRKAVTTGEGGAISTSSADMARSLRALRNHGLDPEAKTSTFVAAGQNTRMTEFQAALGVVQLGKLARINGARASGAARYGELLAKTPLTAPVVVEPGAHVYQSYVTLLPRELAPKRQELIGELRARGVETTIGTWHMPMTEYFRTRYGFAVGDFPVADDVFARALTLPLYEGLLAEQQETVVREISALL